eukprot:9264486-Pyramimonas_sp.AAC.1
MHADKSATTLCRSAWKNGDDARKDKAIRTLLWTLRQKFYAREPAAAGLEISSTSLLQSGSGLRGKTELRD